MNERLKQLRKALKLSQKDLGAKLGVGRDVIVNMELNRAEIKPLFIGHLCEVFNVSEDWLHTGNGDMFNQTAETVIEKFVEEFKLDIYGQKILETFLSLNEIEQKSIHHFLSSFVEACKEKTPTENKYISDNTAEAELKKRLSSTKTIRNDDSKEMEIAEESDPLNEENRKRIIAYTRELEDEQRGTTSSASTALNVNKAKSLIKKAN